METRAAIGPDNGPFAVDVLTAPESNPWLAQTRFTGLDFFPDGRIAACSWDGDVWIVEGQPGKADLRWQRIATGLFQPLGLKIVDDKIHLICRDQLAQRGRVGLLAQPATLAGGQIGIFDPAGLAVDLGHVERPLRPAIHRPLLTLGIRVAAIVVRDLTIGMLHRHIDVAAPWRDKTACRKGGGSGQKAKSGKEWFHRTVLWSLCYSAATCAPCVR